MVTCALVINDRCQLTVQPRKRNRTPATLRNYEGANEPLLHAQTDLWTPPHDNGSPYLPIISQEDDDVPTTSLGKDVSTDADHDKRHIGTSKVTFVSKGDTASSHMEKNTQVVDPDNRPR